MIKRRHWDVYYGRHMHVARFTTKQLRKFLAKREITCTSRDPKTKKILAKWRAPIADFDVCPAGYDLYTGLPFKK